MDTDLTLPGASGPPSVVTSTAALGFLFFAFLSVMQEAGMKDLRAKMLDELMNFREKDGPSANFGPDAFAVWLRAREEARTLLLAQDRAA